MQFGDGAGKWNPALKQKLNENFPAPSKPLFVNDFATVFKKYALTNRLTAINQTIFSLPRWHLRKTRSSFKTTFQQAANSIFMRSFVMV